MLSKLFLSIFSEQKCYEILRNIRWPQGVCCPNCSGKDFIHEYDEAPKLQYRCKNCHQWWTDLSDTAFEGTKLPLKFWFYAWERYRLGASTQSVAEELEIHWLSAARMRRRLHDVVLEKQEQEPLEQTVEVDEMYVNAGAKGTPCEGEQEEEEESASSPETPENARENRDSEEPSGRSRGHKKRGRGTAKTGRPPVIGAAERQSGKVRFEARENATQETCHDFVHQHVASGATVMTDEWRGYSGLDEEDYDHQTVAHGAGEYARQEGEEEVVHINTMEGWWSVIRPWLNTFRGLRQDRLPRYLAFIELVLNWKRRCVDGLNGLLQLVLDPDSTWTSEFACAAVDSE